MFLGINKRGYRKDGADDIKIPSNTPNSIRLHPPLKTIPILQNAETMKEQPPSKIFPLSCAQEKNFFFYAALPFLPPSIHPSHPHPPTQPRTVIGAQPIRRDEWPNMEGGWQRGSPLVINDERCFPHPHPQNARMIFDGAAPACKGARRG
ncbi:hypothetical protein CDAR_40971 [Caerostris darwini]|uniref:Uncharacterized protein n=1 Tax=Caerostris darwini TaxID=1538125 RepID=A0AAV4VFF9_9ARAC|nr:hypothetical protein CDAR_40971 [Caerostris darwini]